MLKGNPDQELFLPLVHRLGFDTVEGDSVDVRQMRKRAIEQTAGAEDEQ